MDSAGMEIWMARSVGCQFAACRGAWGNGRCRWVALPGAGPAGLLNNDNRWGCLHLYRRRNRGRLNARRQQHQHQRGSDSGRRSRRHSGTQRGSLFWRVFADNMASQ